MCVHITRHAITTRITSLLFETMSSINYLKQAKTQYDQPRSSDLTTKELQDI